MARGGRKTPPPPNRTPIVTRSRSQDNIPLKQQLLQPKILGSQLSQQPLILQAVIYKKFLDNLLLNHTNPLLVLGNHIARGVNL